MPLDSSPTKSPPNAHTNRAGASSSRARKIEPRVKFSVQPMRQLRRQHRTSQILDLGSPPSDSLPPYRLPPPLDSSDEDGYRDGVGRHSSARGHERDRDRERDRVRQREHRKERPVMRKSEPIAIPTMNSQPKPPEPPEWSTKHQRERERRKRIRLATERENQRPVEPVVVRRPVSPESPFDDSD